MKKKFLLLMAIVSMVLVGRVQAQDEVTYEVVKEWNFRGYTGTDKDPLELSTTVAEVIERFNIFPTVDAQYKGLIFQAAFIFRTQGGLMNGNNSRRYGIQNLVAGQRLIIETDHVEEGRLISTSVASYNTTSSTTTLMVCDIIADGTAAFWMNNGKSIFSIKIESPAGAVIEPTIEVTGVNGIQREVTISSDTPEVEIKYNIDGSDNYSDYTGPITISETTTFKAYAVKNNKMSSEASRTIEAGIEVQLNTPAVALVAIEGYKRYYEISYNKADVLLTPEATLYYKLGDGNDVEYTGRFFVEESGTLTVVARATGYADSEPASAVVDCSVNYALTAQYDFTKWSLESLQKLDENDSWPAYDATNNRNRYHRTDGGMSWNEFALPELVGVNFDFEQIIIPVNKTTGVSTGIRKQASRSGSKGVTVSGLHDGQYLEFVYNGAPTFIYASNGECSYQQPLSSSDAITLTAINIYTPAANVPAKSGTTDLAFTGYWTPRNYADDLLADLTNSVTTLDFSNMTVYPSYLGTALNPNCLIYLPADAADPTFTWTNIVKGDAATSIALVDRNPYNNTKAFTAASISYTRDFSLTTINNWASLYLPFNVAETDLQGLEVETYGSKATGYVVFNPATSISANTPYIAKVTTPGEITLEATDQSIGITSEAASGPDEFKGTYTCLTGDAALGNYVLVNDGSAFDITAEGATIPVFRAYIPGSALTSRTLVLHEDNPTDVDTNSPATSFALEGGKNEIRVFAPEAMIANLRTIDGRTVRTLQLNEGNSTISGLAAGIYLLNQHKVIVK